MFQKNYFKGWYFKCCTDNKSIAFISALHRNNGKETASLQIITNNTAYNINFDFLKYNENPLNIEIGNCIFSEKEIILNIKNEKLNVHGIIFFKNLSPIKYDIMGPFKFVPFLQCRHSVFSMKHLINGQITLNNQKYTFHNNCGYIEGDCGTSFPKQYIWTQCIFNNGSLMLSVADIPMYGLNFTGIIGVILINKRISACNLPWRKSSFY